MLRSVASDCVCETECVCVCPTDGCDDSSSEEEGGAQVPQAAVVGQCLRRIHSWTDRRHNLLEGEKKKKGEIKLVMFVFQSSSDHNWTLSNFGWKCPVANKCILKH